MPIRIDYSQISKPKKKRAAPAKPKTTSKGPLDPAAARRLEQEAVKKNLEWSRKNSGVGPGRAPKKPSFGELGEARWKKFVHEQDTKRTFAQGGSGMKRDPRYDKKR